MPTGRVLNIMRIPAVLLVVVGLVVALTLHLAGKPRRAHEEAGIETAFHRAAVRPEERPPLVARVQAYVREYEGPEARWFAATTLLRMGEAEQAIDLLFDDPAIAADPASARRFGEILLRVLGFEDIEGLDRPTLGAAQALLALADGSVPQAWERVDQTARETADQAVLTFFDSLFASTTRATNELVAAGLRARGLEHTAVVAALATLDERPYPGKDADLDRLIEIVEGTMRVRVPLVWALACIALGRSEDPRALAALERAMARLRQDPRKTKGAEVAILAAGLVAAGRWDAVRAIEPFLEGERANSPVRHVVRRRDPEPAPPRRPRGSAALPGALDARCGPGRSLIWRPIWHKDSCSGTWRSPPPSRWRGSSRTWRRYPSASRSGPWPRPGATGAASRARGTCSSAW